VVIATVDWGAVGGDAVEPAEQPEAMPSTSNSFHGADMVPSLSRGDLPLGS